MIRNIRNRFDRKSIAFIAIFAVALTGSGIGSLAALYDTTTTAITASVTSIDVTSNGVKTAEIDFGQVLPGDFRVAPIVLHNGGNGYATITAAAVSNGSLVANDSRINFYAGLSDCTPATALPFNEAGGLVLNQPSLDLDPATGGVSRVLAAGESFALCVAYRIGAVANSGYGPTGMIHTITVSATHP